MKITPLKLHSDKNYYHKICAKVAPAIFWNTELHVWQKVTRITWAPASHILHGRNA
jgi:hypothetical protein